MFSKISLVEYNKALLCIVATKYSFLCTHDLNKIMEAISPHITDTDQGQ